MFTIVISEKGGAERRETFEKNEISIGRVQGNDLMLPKGNVSKHHARLLSRDGRFIVTDLKSTNGTYVNGRKTSQATIVREGDKVYVGDFVLRIETGQSADGSVGDQTLPRALAVGREPASLASQAPSAPASPAPPQPSVVAPPPAPSTAQARGTELSHYPLERDPDSESAPELAGVMPHVPGPPRIPQTLGVRPRAVVSAFPAGPARAPGTMRQSPNEGAARRDPRKPSPRQVALITLVDRIADVVDLSPLEGSTDVTSALREQIVRAATEQATAMRTEGEAPADVDLDPLVNDAVQELVGLGPIAAALDDDDVVEIHVARADSVFIKRKGERLALVEPSFTSDEAVTRIVGRLASRAGEPLGAKEPFIERRLSFGAILVAIGPPATTAWVLSIRKRRRAEGTVEDLVRDRTLSRAMADFLLACVRARFNLLVVGSGPSTSAMLLSALALAVPAGERVVVLQDEDEIALPDGQGLSLWTRGQGTSIERLGAAVCRLGAERVLVGGVGSPAGLAVIDAIEEGCDGVIAAYSAPTLARGIARLASRVSMTRVGVSTAVARDALIASFDIGIEVARDARGHLRVRRIAELSTDEASGAGIVDIFVSTSEGGAWSFTSTGASQRITHELAARGVPLEPTTNRAD